MAQNKLPKKKTCLDSGTKQFPYWFKWIPKIIPLYPFLMWMWAAKSTLQCEQSSIPIWKYFFNFIILFGIRQTQFTSVNLYFMSKWKVNKNEILFQLLFHFDRLKIENCCKSYQYIFFMLNIFNFARVYLDSC